MKTANKTLMSEALESLKGKWAQAVYLVFVYGIFTLFLKLTPILGGLISLIVSGPIALGFAIFWLNISRGKEAKVLQVLEPFNTWWRAVKAYLLLIIYILLWTLLLIIPGIIAAFSYAMTYYILADDKDIGVNAAIDKSKEMMKGNKWKLFCLYLRFIGWALLCVLTLGIGFLWLVPYVSVSLAKFYDDIKSQKSEVINTELAAVA